MTSSNIPPSNNSNESRERGKKSVTENMLETLIQSGIQKHLGNQPIDPEIYNTYSKNPKPHFDKIRDAIRYLKETNKEYAGI